MRENELEKLKEILSTDERTLTEANKTYEIVASEYQGQANSLKVFLLLNESKTKKQPVLLKSLEEQYASIVKGISKSFKQFYSNYQNVVGQQKKIAALCSRELKRSLSRTSKTNPSLKSKRINKELNTSIRKSTRVEVAKLKKEEKEEEIKRKKDEEEKECLRQKRKFNYLMSQTEAFASFFLNKKRRVDGLEETQILGDERLINKPESSIPDLNSSDLNLNSLDPKVAKATMDQLAHLKEFEEGSGKVPKPDQYEYQFVAQPKMLKGKLKAHQLKGLNWLVNLYNQGINGILADDMGLGKTIQSISLLAHLAESEGVWGPFLIVTPSSTLHNWTTELERFTPSFNVLGYWGNIQERKDLRKQLRKANVVVTSYQVAVSDESFMSRMKWQYMILDEAQAIKSINSQRWNILLGFKARNRLLLTGTPIQNGMQELWSLLHFIMPTLFDSLAEFSEWFSKDIESRTKIEDDQINKLHTMLKPFMLRRNKSDIKDEIGSKEVVNVFCKMNSRQKVLYEEIIESKMDYENIIMQLKKVCNHPDLFEKLEPSAPFCVPCVGENGLVEFRSFYTRYIPDCSKGILLDMENQVKFAGCANNENSLLIKSSINNSLINMTSGQNLFELTGKGKLRAKKSHLNFIRKEFEPDQDKLYIHADLERRRNAIENSFRRFKFVTEKVLDKHFTTNLDAQPPVMPVSLVDRLVSVPPLNMFISDSGKLARLDILLMKLKEEGHRVLIYFQMTRMMDLFEDYLVKKEFSYLRLDGSSKIIQRKELVDQWQNNTDLFIFILSTRAGGVGINLTAADTVIFYDSDWNPTVDQQAMDRAHRLGQKKDVMVYRLITLDSVEERVIEMANRKEEVQKIVIKGNVFEGSYLDQ